MRDRKVSIAWAVRRITETGQRRFYSATFSITLALIGVTGTARAETNLLNVSYDVTRELYQEIDPAFTAYWQKTTGETVTVKQSHGGSSPQALSVLQGLQADVVTMNQSSDIDVLVQKGGLVDKNWRKAFPNNASPYTTTMIFLVRKGNPKQIKDWDDLAKPGVQVILPNPKTSGNGRYSYLAAWGWRVQHGGSDAQAQQFVQAILHNVPVLDTGGRGATTSFAQRNLGDVLVTFENEVALIQQEFGPDKFETVYPSESLLAEPPVAVVDKNVDRHKTRREATAFLHFLWSPEGQTIIAKHHLRPRDLKVLKEYASTFHPIKTFTIDQVFGSWDKAQDVHFKDGGTFDKAIMAAKH
ncbi:sulfate ABC transporter substrate-binding protein [Robbsia andropogonis]|uniref:sulfate ABC transporter substrate-binding protein n=1 Tax=Robbsia andropogonis TaxID=28092 RepID=UPI0004BB836A|nr:sulfate ABC transporter substrate-binding protein [Robbsia andropogonis]MCP1120952.1 sulfate ABC transporter substrate-binding protein [Robbsia andropogonis]MCP1130767.1 sulfate ABC transporter substrate-binding protein [Robbsia andropogonis]